MASKIARMFNFIVDLEFLRFAWAVFPDLSWLAIV